MSERIFSNQQKSLTPVSEVFGSIQRATADNGNVRTYDASGTATMVPKIFSASDSRTPVRGHDFTQIPVHSDKNEASHLVSILRNAESPQSRPLDPMFQHGLEQHLGQDLSYVRLHEGPATARAADHLGARAYTLGSSIYLGSEVSSLSQRERAQLLAHEVVHTLQQGGAKVTPHAGLAISSPYDAAEREAEQVAATFDAAATPPASPSLALRDLVRANSGRRQAVARMVVPQLQRDLSGKKAVKDGEFDLNLKTESHPGAKNGMSGTIKFTASDKAPDSNNIRLLQTVRDEDLTTGKEYQWTGGEANRNKVMTAASKGIDPGYFVDVLHTGRSPRAKKTDAPVSPYYIVDYGTGGGNQDGSKKGKTVKEASLWDYPGSSGNRRFSFETAAKAADTGYIYATLTWGFTISDASKGKVEKEHATAHRSPSATFGAAVKAFDVFYKNPGSSTAP
jgi:hypothetical protein